MWRYLFKEKVQEQKFAVVENKPFAIVIPSYNNLNWYKKNLESVLEQNYSNFRVLYIDDASTDGMSGKVQEYLQQKDLTRRVEYIRNSSNQGAMANLYHAIHRCADNEIVVVLDGDDWLAHDGVLTRLNEFYANPEVWLTYGNYVEYPSYKKIDNCSKQIPPKIVKDNSFRSYKWSASHLRTFYAGLFKKIALQDLLLDGKFYESTYDLACMFPMLEMAGPHAQFVKDVLCIYNRQNPLNDDKVRFEKQQALNHHIRALPPYGKLAALNSQEPKLADLVAFSFDRPLQLYSLLESVERYVDGLGSAAVIYRASDDHYRAAYEELKSRFPKVKFYAQGKSPKEDFKPLVLDAVFSSPSPYVVFAVDDIIVKDFVDLRACARALEETGAYGFYLRLGGHIDYCYMLDKKMDIPPSIDLGGGIFAWQFSSGEADWRYPNTVDLTVYEKKQIEPSIRAAKFSNPSNFESNWMKSAQSDKIGLYFKSSKMINIPINRVATSAEFASNRQMQSYSTEELLEKFRSGLKIDIAPFHQIENHSPHSEHEISFIPR